MNIKSNHIFSLILFFLIIKSVNGQSNDCKEPSGGCKVIREGINCNNLTPEEAKSPCVQWQCCKTRKAAKKRAATKEDIPKESSKVKETKKTLNVSGSSGGDSKRNESENDENTDYHQGRRDTKKALEQERIKKTKESRDKLTKSIGQGLGSIISSWANGDSYLRFAYGLRELEGEHKNNIYYNERSSVTFSTLEIGYGFGKLGIFLGGGLPPAKLSSPTDDATGFTGFGGLEYTLFKHRKGFAIGINSEVGFGNLKIIYSGSSDGNISTSKYPSTFYSFGAQVTLFKFLYVSYNYGFYSTETTRSYSNGTPDSVFDATKDEFSKIAFGLIFDLGY